MARMAQQSRVGELLVGKYRLDTLLGSGGVGEVYRAQNTLIGRTVAIKLLKPELSTDEHVIARFIREARAATLARHPNVVEVLDVGRDEDGIPFIVQEFLEGMDLGQRLKRENRPLPPRQVLDLLIPVVQAVGLAHARGVVHRDLKPENVFLARVDGKTVPKLLDFGISYIKPQPGDIRMTKTGMTVGTPAYMSPEQLEGTAGVDVRTDVWALGVILYEALAGRLPFEGETSALLFAQIAWVDPMPLIQAAPHVPEDLSQVVGRCLQRKITARYPSAAELARDLVHVRAGRPIEPTHRRSVIPPPEQHGDVDRALRSQASTDPPAPDLLPVAASIEGPSRGVEHSGIALATLRPPPAPKVVSAPTPEVNLLDRWLGIIVFVAAILFTGGLWMTLIHQADGWAAHEWLVSTFGSPGTVGSLAVALGATLCGGWLAERLIRVRPRLWGLVVSILGFALMIAPVAIALATSTPHQGAPWMWGWGIVLVVAGLGLAGARHAWATWERGDTLGKVLGTGLAAGATAAFFCAFEVLRGIV